MPASCATCPYCHADLDEQRIVDVCPDCGRDLNPQVTTEHEFQIWPLLIPCALALPALILQLAAHTFTGFTLINVCVTAAGAASAVLGVILVARSSGPRAALGASVAAFGVLSLAATICLHVLWLTDARGISTGSSTAGLTIMSFPFMALMTGCGGGPIVGLAWFACWAIARRGRTA